MALNAKNIKGNNAERVEQPNIEPGTYPARLVQIIDLGLQAQRPYKGQDKPPVQEIMLTYELVDTFMVDKDGNDVEDKPRWISETLPFYGLYADKAKSTQRYNAFDPNGDFGGDFSKAIEQPVNVTIVNNAGQNGKIYDNVATISTMRQRDADKCPELVNPSKVFDLDAPDMEVFNSLPQWIQDKIKENLNYEGSALQKLAGAGGEKKPAAKPDVEKQPKNVRNVAKNDPAGDEDDDNAPY
jgi:hypothetical protein